MSSPSVPGQPLTLAFVADPNSIHTRRWLGYFLDRGHHVHLILASDRPRADGLDPRIALHHFPRQSRRWIRFSGVIRARLVMRRLLREMGADVLHAHYLTGYGWLGWLSGFHPLAITVWGSDIFLTPRESRIARIWARLALHGADAVTADSVSLAEATIAAGARRSRVRVVQFGVDTGRFTPGSPDQALRARLGLVGRRMVFLPRAVAPLYRTHVAVEALQELPDDVVLVITEHNADPVYLAEVRAAAVHLGVEDRIRSVPPIAHGEMVDFLRLADVVLSIPETDATPVSVLEAMACGRPVVATDLPSVREWLAEVDVDFLVSVGDVAGTAAAIARVLASSGEQLIATQDALRSIAVNRGDQDRNMLEVEALYRHLAGRRA